MYSERCRFFLALRDREGNALTTAMLPPGGKDRGGFRIIIVAASNADPYPQQDAAIAALGAHFGLTLDRNRLLPPTAVKEPDKYRRLIGAMSAHVPLAASLFRRPDVGLRGANGPRSIWSRRQRVTRCGH